MLTPVPAPLRRDPAALAPLPPTIAWRGDTDGCLLLLDQTLLPAQRVVLELHDGQQVADAIRRLCVRGAPAIGVAAAYGLVLGVRARHPLRAAFVETVREEAVMLASTRPTAVNLGWALDRCVRAAVREPGLPALLEQARAIHREDEALCRRLGEHGAALVPDGGTVLTHCNTGRLATAGDGTALAALFTAWQQGRRFRVLADETRPLLQGTRLTALELAAAGIPVEVLVDSAAAGLIARGEVQLVLVGADRIAQNGDTANKVGTYGLALACQAHGVPFWVISPASSFDLALPHGASIPLEQRGASEVLAPALAADLPSVGVRNPAFDLTPARLITGIVTEHGLIRPVTAANVKALLSASR